MTNNMGAGVAEGVIVTMYQYGLVVVALIVCINILLALKVFQDARPRVGKQAIVFLILTLACGPAGCMVWMLARPNRRLNELGPHGPPVQGPPWPPLDPGP